MGFALTPINMLYFVSYLSPMIFSFFMVMTSIFNQDLKGFAYLVGVLVFCLVGGSFLRPILKQTSINADEICRMVDIPIIGNEFTTPVFSTMIIAFTLLYLLIPMMNTETNIPLVVSLVVLTLMDIFVNYHRKCANLTGILVSLFIGMIFGTAWYFMMSAISPELTYFSDTPSNRVVCQKPKAKTYKCKVYKNGKLLKTI